MQDQAAASWAVLVFDMARTGEPDGERLVDGFASLEAARAYAEARVRGSVEELREPGQAPDALRRLWHMFGEDCVVIGGGYSGRDALDRYIARPADAAETDWPSLAPGAAPPRERRYYAAVSVSARTLPPGRRFVHLVDWLKAASRPSRAELLTHFAGAARAAFARQGVADVELGEASVVHLFELPDPPKPATDGRPERRWAVEVDFVCDDVKFGSTTGAVFAWPERPDGAALDAMRRLVVAAMLSMRGDGPEFADGSRILATRVEETDRPVTYD